MNSNMLRRSCSALALVLGFGLAAPQAGAAPDTTRLNALLGALESQGMAMGSVAVQEGTGALYTRAIGQARLEGDKPETATANTRYRIGSISKLLTAVMVLQLVDQGVLALDTPIARWFPALPGADGITVAQLLQHRSGLGDIKSLPDFEKSWMFEPRSEAELVTAISSLPRRFEPGQRCEYNNSGFLLLSFILEKVGGQPYAQALQRRLVQPLGLRNTRFDLRAGLKPQEAASYRWDGQWRLVPATDPSVPLGAGGVLSSASDLVVFMRALFQGRLLKASTLQKMLQTQDNFGLGIYKLPGAGPEAWGHEGVIDGFSAALLHVPSTATTIAWCGNAHQVPREEVVQLLRRAVFEPSTRLPSFAPVQASVAFVVDVGQPAPASVSVRGNAAPLTWERNLPLSYDLASGQWQGRVQLTVRDGVPLEFKYLKGEQQWETTPNRVLLLTEGQQAQRADLFNQDEAMVALRQEVLAADERLFDAYNRRDLAGMAAVFSERLEFFHDKGGLSNYADNLRAFENIFKTNAPVRRDRVAAGQEVFPIGKFGAFHSGSHRFCLTARQPESCQTYRYANVWERTPQGLRLLRVVSYDH
jgi:D-alanyl-D-alanine carboxypeptidase